mgnify:FL=1
MLNILFWNLNRNSIEKDIVECLAENNIDIAIFTEYSAINIIEIVKNLGQMYVYVEGAQKDTKIIIVAKTTLEVTIIQQQNRYSLCHVKNAIQEYLLAGIHLEDKRNYKTSDRINKTIKPLVNDIEQAEKSFECDNTVVIGDFNADPYSEELLSKYSFNAVLFKSIIKKSEFTNPISLPRKRFYNPILHYISEDTEMYGSFYYENDHMTSYWYCLDQVLVRKNLVDMIKHVEYLKKIGSTNLLKNNVPDKSISDHLPLLIKLQEVINEV